MFYTVVFISATGERNPVNLATSFVDASFLYGSTLDTSESLRVQDPIENRCKSRFIYLNYTTSLIIKIIKRFLNKKHDLLIIGNILTVNRTNIATKYGR